MHTHFFLPFTPSLFVILFSFICVALCSLIFGLSEHFSYPCCFDSYFSSSTTGLLFFFFFFLGTLYGWVGIISCLSACALSASFFFSSSFLCSFFFFLPLPQCHLLVSAEHRQEWRRNCGNWDASTRTRRERSLTGSGGSWCTLSVLSPLSGGKSHLWSAPVIAMILLPAAQLLSKIRTFLSGFRDATDIVTDPKGTVY